MQLIILLLYQDARSVWELAFGPAKLEYYYELLSNILQLDSVDVYGQRETTMAFPSL